MNGISERNISKARTASGAAVNTIRAQGQTLSCTPALVDFEDVRNGLLYVMAVSVRNHGKHSRRIRLSLDQQTMKAGFTLTFDPPGATAPGLDARAEIDFQIPEGVPESQNEFKGVLSVSSGNDRLEVPLLARRPTPDVQFDALCDLGACVRDGTVSKMVEFRNMGTAPAPYKIEFGEEWASTLIISPCEGVLAPLRQHLDLDGDGDVEMANEVVTNESASRQEIHLTLDPKELGPVRILCTVKIAGQADKLLDISAQVVEQKLEIVSADGYGQLDKLDFGPLLYGQTRNFSGVLINHGPQSTGYSISLEIDKATRMELEQIDRELDAEMAEDDDTNDDDHSVPGSADDNHADEDEDELLPLPIVVSPLEGIIGPYAELPVSFIFEPPAIAVDKGFKNSGKQSRKTRRYCAVMMIEAADIKQTLTVKLQAKAVRPAVEISQKIMRFGECPCYDRRDLLVNLKNPTELPVQFELAKCAQFAAKPMRGTLQANQTASIVFSFVPAQMGTFKNVMTLTTNKGIQKILLSLQGTSNSMGQKKRLVGGIDKQPKDFKPQYKFVKAEIAAGLEKTAEPSAPKPKFLRKKPWEKLTDSNLLTTVSWDEDQHAPEQGRKEGKLTYSLQEIQRRAEHREGYMDWLRRAREEREAKVAAKEMKMKNKRAHIRTGGKHVARNPNQDDPINLGMERGLDEPEMPLPAAVDKLWLASDSDTVAAGPGATTRGGGGGGKKRFVSDENKLIPKKFKSKPTTQAEVRDCESELSSQELLSVNPSHRVLDFGKVCVHSTSAKNFVISNELSKCVLVTLGKMSGEIGLSTPQSQVIPGNNIAGFDIIFRSENEQKFKRVLSYTINERYTFKFTLLAEVVPIEVKLSHSELRMAFPPNSLERSVSEPVKISNPGNASCEYYWSTRGAFSVKPESGTLEPYSSEEVEVIWMPTPGARLQESITVHVPGGQDETLTVIGDLPDARCVFQEKGLDLGLLAVGIERTTYATLRNVGKSPAVFFVDPFPPNSGITVDPVKGRINVGENQPLKVSLKAKTPQSYPNVMLTAAVRGGKLARIPLTAEAIIPEVDLDAEEFFFGGITIGAKDRIPFTLENKSSIPGSILLNFEKFQEFNAEQVLVKQTPLDEHSQSTLKSNEANDYNTMEPADMNTRSRSRLTSDGVFADDTWDWRIVIGPQSKMNFNMTFVPKEVNSHDFKLPMMMEGIENCSRLARRMRGAGVRPRILLSTTTLDFEDKVVSRDPTQLTPYFAELKIKNDDNAGVSWEISDAVLNEQATNLGAQILSSTPPVFFVSPKRGDLVVREETTVRVTFTPRTDEDYEFELPIYLGDQEDRSKAYLTLTLRGSGVYPRLAFDRDPIVLPTVPLQITARAVFTIINHGYPNMELTHRIQPNCPVALELEFPDGKAIGVGKTEIRVLVSFKAEKAVSFTTKLTIYDADGHSYQLSLAGCSDNCLLTNFPFLAMRKEGYDFYFKENTSVKFLPKNQIRQLEAREMRQKEKLKKEKEKQKAKEKGERVGGESPSNMRVTTPKVNEGETVYESLMRTMSQQDMETQLNEVLSEAEAQMGYQIPKASLQFLTKWLSYNVCPSPIENFPEDIIESHGKLALDAIEVMCSRRVPGRMKQVPSQRNQVWVALQSQYNEMLIFLKERGALLNMVRSEFLLGQEDYVKALEYQEQEAALSGGGGRITPAQMKEKRQGWHDQWETVVNEAWATVIYQSVRVFMLSRVTPRQFHSLPGVLLPVRHKTKDGRIPPDPELVGSNIYSVGEGLLLRWVAYHTNNTLPATAFPRRITNFEDDLMDCAAICHVLLSHVPSLATPQREDEESSASFFRAVKARNKTIAPMDGYHGMGSVEELHEDPNLAEENRERILSTLQYLHQDFGLDLEDIRNMDGRCFMLFVLHLYLNIPQLIPKTTIEFMSTLGVASFKSIELRNPNRKAGIQYRVSLEGSDSFSIEDQQLTIGPGSVSQYPVKVHPKFSKPPEEARLTFWNKASGGTWPRPSTLVFLLKSFVQDVKPIQTVETSCGCYDHHTVEVEIANPFEQDVFLSLKINQTLKEPFEFTDHFAAPGKASSLGIAAPGQKDGRGMRKGRPSEASNNSRMRSNTETPEERQLTSELLEMLKTPFSVIGASSLRLEASGTGKIRLSCCPMLPGKYSCDLLFLEETRGEFAYRVVCNVGLPAVTDTMNFTVQAHEQGATIQRELKLPSKNAPFEKACQILVDRCPSQAPKLKVKQALGNMVNRETIEQKLPFTVMLDSPFFSGNDRITVMTDHNLPKGQRKHPLLSLKIAMIGPPEASDTDSNSFMINFNPKAAGSYPCKLLFRSVGMIPDMRLYSLKAQVAVIPTTTSLDFKLPARQSAVQEIPLINSGDVDWSLSCKIEGSRCFTGPTSLQIPAGQQKNYPLRFSPIWICQEIGTLTVRNNVSGDTFEYKLTGEGEEPLAEGHTTISCKARDKMTHVFQVKNHTKAERTFTVESDMLNVQGPSQVTIKGGATVPYQLEISPQSGGTYTGSLTFKAENGEYMWYTMEIQVSAPAEEDTIELSTVVRQAVSVEITLGNPLAEELQFDVFLQGDGLLGDPVFTLAPSEAGPYTLFYSPLLAQEHSGSIAFINDKAGEFWYKLQLSAKPAPPIHVPEMSCMVGGSTKVTMQVENPLGEDVTLTADIDNRRNFGIDQPKVSIAPYGSTDVTFFYTPSSLTETERARIVLRHRKLGAWVYELAGRGEMPGVMNDQSVAATVGEPASHVFTFRNPFGEVLVVDMIMRTGEGSTGEQPLGRVGLSSNLSQDSRGRRSRLMSQLDDPDGEFPFELLVKKLSNIVLAAYSPLQIPISFSPQVISEKRATVEIRGVYKKTNLCWVYPIRGIAEAPTQLRAFHLVTQAKSSTRQDIEVTLRGLAGLNSPESFTHELVFLDDKVKGLAEKSISISPIQSTLKSATDCLKYQVNFDPLKTFHTMIHLVVIRRSGGRWRFEMTLEATAPEPDDIINIEAANNTTANVVFRLNNRFLAYAQFQAYFSTDSAYTLSVSPTSGVLAPYGGEGTQFVVSFSPIEYGKPQKGRLFIETDEMMWSYDIIGTTPAYVLNRNIQSKVSNKLDPNIANQLGKSKSVKRGFGRSVSSKPSIRSLER